MSKPKKNDLNFFGYFDTPYQRENDFERQAHVWSASTLSIYCCVTDLIVRRIQNLSLGSQLTFGIDVDATGKKQIQKKNRNTELYVYIMKTHTNNNFLYRHNRLMRSAVQLQLGNIQMIVGIPTKMCHTTNANLHNALDLSVSFLHVLWFRLLCLTHNIHFPFTHNNFCAALVPLHTVRCYLRRSRFSLPLLLCVCLCVFFSSVLWLCCFAFIHVPKRAVSSAQFGSLACSFAIACSVVC